MQVRAISVPESKATGLLNLEDHYYLSSEVQVPKKNLLKKQKGKENTKWTNGLEYTLRKVNKE